MTPTSQRLVLWGPRIAGILLALFLGIFALDAFEGRPAIDALPAFAVHVIPSLVVLAVVAIAWQFEWVGGLGFIALAAIYGLTARAHLDWVVVISGPLALVGGLFVVSWRRHARARAPQ